MEHCKRYKDPKMNHNALDCPQLDPCPHSGSLFSSCITLILSMFFPCMKPQRGYILHFLTSGYVSCLHACVDTTSSTTYLSALAFRAPRSMQLLNNSLPIVRALNRKKDRNAVFPMLPCTLVRHT